VPPRIRTERLVLRGHRLDDFPDALAMWSDPDVTRFIGGLNLDDRTINRPR
jgi:RimJ/RimL family protein N-acetyltransferase